MYRVELRSFAGQMASGVFLCSRRRSDCYASPFFGHSTHEVPKCRIDAIARRDVYTAAERAPGEGQFFLVAHIHDQILGCYLVCSPPTVILIDQHAAHERIAFERLRLSWGQRR